MKVWYQRKYGIKMRITLNQAKIIVKQVKTHFGKSTKVYLFGSRVNDTDRGGDIDLFIIPGSNDDSQNDKNNLHIKKIKALTALKQKLGDRQIDIVISENRERLIEKQALKRGVLLNINNLKIEKIIKECDKHLLRVNNAFEDISPKLPMTAHKYINLSKNDIQAVDQYLYRFSMLQDTLGNRLFKLIAFQYFDNPNGLTFVDILDHLEKTGFIHSAEEWIILRNIRNDLSHQYDDEPAQMADALNNILSKKGVLEDIFLNLKKKLTR
jgi:predicted nucleotidyltransferase